jgi:hypothetical protein
MIQQFSVKQTVIYCRIYPMAAIPVTLKEGEMAVTGRRPAEILFCAPHAEAPLPSRELQGPA